MPDPSTEDIEKRLLACTAPLHPLQAGSEELLLRLFREQDARLRRRRLPRLLSCTLPAAAACLVFGAIVCIGPQLLPATSELTARPPLPPAEPGLPEEDDLDSGIPEDTIDDIMNKALANTP